jgi:hypothetical protein
MTEAVDWPRLANALRELHRGLVEVVRREYESAHLTELGAGELLQLLTTAPEFAWLRALSELMVDLDFVREAAPAAQADTASVARGSVEHLLSNAQDPAGEFARRYWPYVHSEPRVAMAHAAVKQALSGWPAADMDAATLLAERHRLTEKARHLAKRKPSE